MLMKFIDVEVKHRFTWPGHFTQGGGLAPPAYGIPQARPVDACLAEEREERRRAALAYPPGACATGLCRAAPSLAVLEGGERKRGSFSLSLCVGVGPRPSPRPAAAPPSHCAVVWRRLPPCCGGVVGEGGGEEEGEEEREEERTAPARALRRHPT